MAIQLQPGETSISRIVNAIIQLVQGRQNNTGVVTLSPGAASSVVSFTNCSPGCAITLSPQTANAAAALATTYIPAATILRKQFTIQHANNAQVDRTFRYEVTGGD